MMNKILRSSFGKVFGHSSKLISHCVMKLRNLEGFPLNFVGLVTFASGSELIMVAFAGGRGGLFRGVCVGGFAGGFVGGFKVSESELVSVSSWSSSEAVELMRLCSCSRSSRRSAKSHVFWFCCSV